MMRINGKLDNEFLSNNDDENYPYNKAINQIKKIDNKTTEKSSSYTLENTEYLQRKIENIHNILNHISQKCYMKFYKLILIM